MKKKIAQYSISAPWITQSCIRLSSCWRRPRWLAEWRKWNPLQLQFLQNCVIWLKAKYAFATQNTKGSEGEKKHKLLLIVDFFLSTVFFTFPLLIFPFLLLLIFWSFLSSCHINVSACGFLSTLSPDSVDNTIEIWRTQAHKIPRPHFAVYLIAVKGAASSSVPFSRG